MQIKMVPGRTTTFITITCKKKRKKKSSDFLTELSDQEQLRPPLQPQITLGNWDLAMNQMNPGICTEKSKEQNFTNVNRKSQ